ncbi:MAG: cryptochrome/photolyase family protein [Acidobacteriota bacterium]|nr:cryptochrome/photolyase family protein [Acidobacteriota bacterium]
MLRNLVVVLGDQLNQDSSAFDGFDAKRDVVWMAEVREESTHAWSHKARIAVFLAAMRHFRNSLEDRGIEVHYRNLEDPGNLQSFKAELAAAVRRLRPKSLIVTEPGEWRVREDLKAAAIEVGAPLEIRTDRHFLAATAEFAAYARETKQLRMEFFYRAMRKKYAFLMEGGKPLGGKWNYDPENRKSFGKSGPTEFDWLKMFPPDAVSREVIEMVEREFPDHPGELSRFDFPVTPADAREALAVFIREALPHFGDYQDAMWTGQPWLFHSRLSSAMNLKLIDPREVIRAAEQAYHDGHVKLHSAEGFIRQILGWREYVRGVYWLLMPGYLERNYLGATEKLPWFYWTGETDMACLHDALGQTLRYGYAHHIQRLMVNGLFCLLLGVAPREVHGWYLAIYADAVEWVELPNTLGMSQYGDGGVMGSKPYVASGKYIQRMSNYCTGCRYNPAESVGEIACPFTTLYWDFLMRHEKMLIGNPRMIMQVKNLTRISAPKKRAIQERAEALRQRFRQ